MYKFFITFLSLFIVRKKDRIYFRQKCLQGAEKSAKWQRVLCLFLLSITGERAVEDAQIPEIFHKPTLARLNHTNSNLRYLFNGLLFPYTYFRRAKYVLRWGSPPVKNPLLCAFAAFKFVPVVRVEDGFLRSADTWCNTQVAQKYTRGISFTFSNDVHYFDATCSSYMERRLEDKQLVLSSEQLARARRCIDFITKHYLTKYNHQPIYSPSIGSASRPKVLVVDQSYGDFSISKGLANENTFREMLQAAVRENPTSDIIVKTHPDTLATGSQRKRGYYSYLRAEGNVHLLTTPINPIALLKTCDKVYVCSTQLGFEALLCGKEVHVFGMPFYAGWGLTVDALTCPRRTMRRSLEEIFYIAYILCSHYINPETGRRCEIEAAMAYLLKLREQSFREFEVRCDFKDAYLL